MSILIKEIQMPESCSKCFVNPACCPAIRKRLESKYQPYTWIPANYRHEDCPLVEVSPHGRLIDADALVKEVEDIAKEFPSDSIGAERFKLFAKFITEMPTIIPAEEGET